MSKITGRRVLVDSLSMEERQALVGKQVAACRQRNSEEFDEWDIGTVYSAREDEGILIWVRFDSDLAEIGCFDEEYIIILGVTDNE